MKKFIVVLVVVLALFSFAACASYNDSALLERISKLEQELADAKQGGGIKGDKGDKGEQGEAGAYNDTDLKNRISELENQQTGSKTYKMGDTCNVYNNGLLLYSITFDSIDIGITRLLVTLKNYTVPQTSSSSRHRGIFFYAFSIDENNKVIYTTSADWGYNNGHSLGESTAKSIGYSLGAVRIILATAAQDEYTGGSPEWNYLPFAVFEF